MTRAVSVPQIVKGELRVGHDVSFMGSRPFTTARISVDDLVWSRTAPGPAFDLPSSEIIDLLVAVGERLQLDDNIYLQEALESLSTVGGLATEVLETSFRSLGRHFNRETLTFECEEEVGLDALDGWREVSSPDGTRSRTRAFPPRLVHILAGNAPGVAASTIARASLTKGVHLLKLPSNDLYSATAILRTMNDVAPGHPIVRSFSAVYWRGGDEAIEQLIFRPQYIDKIVVWGGESSIRNAVKYLGPGLELVSFDPKTSASFIGRESFHSDAVLMRAAELAAVDATLMNQDACVSSRYQFVEASAEDADRFCEYLVAQLGVERAFSCGRVDPLPRDVQEEVEVLRDLEPDFRVWGGFDGAGLVVRSPEPVAFYPTGRTVNVIPVRSLDEAVRYTNVATSTVGVFPSERIEGLRDALGNAGVQRVTPLGGAGTMPPGLPHDGLYPLHRFVRWVVENVNDDARAAM